MKPYSVLVLTLCIISAFAEDSSIIPQGVGDVINIFHDCGLEGLAPCLKLKALNLIDRVSRMEKITLIDGVEIKGKSKENLSEPSLEDEEKNLPRSLDAKDNALTNMIINRVSKMIGSKSIEISVPKLIETARGGGGGGDGGGGGGGEGGGFFEKFGNEGGGGGGGGKQKKSKKGNNQKGQFLEYFAASLLAKKIAMIPLYIATLAILAFKAFVTSKIALLIIGLISAQKLLNNKEQGPPAVHHVQTSSGGHGGWSGGGAGGGGWEGGWDRRALHEAQNLAFKGQQPT